MGRGLGRSCIIVAVIVVTGRPGAPFTTADSAIVGRRTAASLAEATFCGGWARRWWKQDDHGMLLPPQWAERLCHKLLHQQRYGQASLAQAAAHDMVDHEAGPWCSANHSSRPVPASCVNTSLAPQGSSRRARRLPKKPICVTGPRYSFPMPIDGVPDLHLASLGQPMASSPHKFRWPPPAPQKQIMTELGRISEWVQGPGGYGHGRSFPGILTTRSAARTLFMLLAEFARRRVGAAGGTVDSTATVAPCSYQGLRTANLSLRDADCWSLRGQPQTLRPTSALLLRVMSWNLLQGQFGGLACFADAIKSINADIICLQESPNGDWVEKLASLVVSSTPLTLYVYRTPLQGMKYYAWGLSSSANHPNKFKAIISRTLLQGLREFDLGDRPGWQASALQATTMVQGFEFAVLNFHQIDQMQKIASIAQKSTVPMIACGDYNLNLAAPEGKTLLKNKALRPAWLDLGLLPTQDHGVKRYLADNHHFHSMRPLANLSAGADLSACVVENYDTCCHRMNGHKVTEWTSTVDKAKGFVVQRAKPRGTFTGYSDIWQSYSLGFIDHISYTKFPPGTVVVDGGFAEPRPRYTLTDHRM
eukprot:gene9779-1763_t